MASSGERNEKETKDICINFSIYVIVPTAEREAGYVARKEGRKKGELGRKEMGEDSTHDSAS